MNRRFHVSEEAKADADEIFRYVAVHWVPGAIAWFKAYRRALDRIAEAPESFALAADLTRHRRPVREVIFKTRRGNNYRVVYEVKTDEIQVLRVQGPGRRPLRVQDLPSD